MELTYSLPGSCPFELRLNKQTVVLPKCSHQQEDGFGTDFKTESVECFLAPTEEFQNPLKTIEKGQGRLLFELLKFLGNINFIKHRFQLLVSFGNLKRGKDQGFPYWQFASTALSFFFKRR